ncbi:MAG TPA: hypothetical protein VJS44_18355 [Pyrinomonadaceae bacterium]|nr:hypothetical protein [Pyrinomonadaceae bacterium]
MTIVLELKPEVEARLKALAATQGVSVEEYIQSFLESLALLDEETSYDSGTPEQWAKEFEEWLDSHDYITAPPLTDEAISRESIYLEREDSQS